MELKKYIDNLRELTNNKQIKWERRTNSSQQIFDCRITGTHLATIIFDITISRVSLIVSHDDGSATHITNLDAHGETYKSLSKLWDVVVIGNLARVAEKWNAVLPAVDKKIKFGPKEDKIIL